MINLVKINEYLRDIAIILGILCAGLWSFALLG